MNRPSSPVWILGLAALLCGTASRAAAVEYSVLASGSAATEAEEKADWQTLILRLVGGDAWQFRIDAPVLFAESQAAVIRTGLGPVGTGSPRDGGTGAGGGGGPGPGGPGSGPGAPPETDGDRHAGIGDVRLAANRRLGGGGTRLFRIDGGIEVKAPTADDEDNLGTGEWDFRVGFSGEYRFWALTAFGGAGWNRLGDPEWVDLRDVVDAYAGVDSEPLAGGIVLSGWIEGHPEVVEATGAWTAIGAGLRTTGATRFRADIVVGVGEASGDYRAMVGLSMGEAVATAGARGALR